MCLFPSMNLVWRLMFTKPLQSNRKKACGVRKRLPMWSWLHECPLSTGKAFSSDGQININSMYCVATISLISVFHIQSVIRISNEEFHLLFRLYFNVVCLCLTYVLLCICNLHVDAPAIWAQVNWTLKSFENMGQTYWLSELCFGWKDLLNGIHSNMTLLCWVRKWNCYLRGQPKWQASLSSRN